MVTHDIKYAEASGKNISIRGNSRNQSAKRYTDDKTIHDFSKRVTLRLPRCMQNTEYDPYI